MREYAAPEFEYKLKLVTQQPEPNPVFVNDLRARIVQTAAIQPITTTPRARLSLQPSWRIITLVLVSILFVAGLVVGPQNVLGAVRNLLGYVPGIGFVDEAGLRVLVEPVTLEREGITLTVEEAVLDNERTVIVYQVEGLSLIAANSQGEGAMTGSVALLQTPDGTLLQQIGGGGPGWASGYQSRLVFPAISAEYDYATLIIPRLETMPADVAPEDWRVRLDFQPAPEDYEVAPVIELEPITAAIPTGTAVIETAAPYDITLNLDKVAELEDGYVLTGYLDWSNTSLPIMGGDLNSWLQLTDANGADIPAEPIMSDLESLPTQHEDRVYWTYQVAGKHHPSPLTLTLESMYLSIAAGDTFQFDPGDAPQLGQVWEIGQTFEINGHSVHLTTVEAIEMRGQSGYQFNFEVDEDVSLISVDDLEHNQRAGAGGGDSNNTAYSTILYGDELPTGMLNITIRDLQVILDGPWQIIWTPPTSTTPQSEDAAPYGIALTLEKAAELEDGYILTGSLDWQNMTLPAQFVSMGSWLTLTDVNGETVPMEPSSTSLDAPSPETTQKEPWAYQVAGKYHSGPLTLSLDAVEVQLPVEATFQFDAGQDPQPGQVWELDQEIVVDAYTLHLISVETNSKRGQPGYRYTFESEAEITQVFATDPEHETGGSGGGRMNPGQVFTDIFYTGELPSGILNITIQTLYVRVAGPWQTIWTPPTLDASAPAPTPVPEVCLTLDSWQALPADQSLPANLSGKLVGYGIVAEPDTYGIFTVNLDGSDRQEIGSGTWPRLSPDGNYVAYSGEQGLYLVDLATDTTTLIPNTTTSDYGPRWSSDGERIAFVRVDDLNLYTINPDGTDLRQITSGVEYELLVGWSPDGDKLYFAPPAEGGFRFKSIDLASGTITEYGLIGGERAAVSPDGQWLAFQDKVFGAINKGLFLSRLDGSERQSLVQLGHWGVGDPVWSPDGNWLLAGVYNTDQMVDAGYALIEPATCQIIKLPYLNGYIYSWVP